MNDPLRLSLARLAERAPAPAESGRTTFRLPARAADALAWLTDHLRTTQKDVLAGLPDVVDDLRGTALWDRLGASLAGGPPVAPPPAAPAPAPARARMGMDAPSGAPFAGGPAGPHAASVPLLPGEAGRWPAAAPPPAPAALPRSARFDPGSFDPAPAAHEEADAGRGAAGVPEGAPADGGARSTYVLPRGALERLTTQADALGLPRDEVVGRALVALRAAVEVREAGRPASLRALSGPVAELAAGARAAAAEALALPPHDPVRVHLERAAAHLADAADALTRPPNSPA